ncbi:hypothetical protein CR513_62622, partial [Mucuna pruriens]
MTTDNAQRWRSNLTRAFTPIPVTYTELLTYLIQNSLVVPFLLKSLQPSYPKNYDSNAKCYYHVGTIGHLDQGQENAFNALCHPKIRKSDSLD